MLPSKLMMARILSLLSGGPRTFTGVGPSDASLAYPAARPIFKGLFSLDSLSLEAHAFASPTAARPEAPVAERPSCAPAV